MARADRALVQRVAARAAALGDASVEALRERADACRADGVGAADSIKRIVEVFALASEACRRVTGMAPYDTQILAGLYLARGCIAEMATGEGKTLAAVMPGCLHGLSGRGVHVMTVNEYLAARDYDSLAPVYGLLGLSAGMTRAGQSLADKARAYRCDITFGTGPEFGFDYLRDQMRIQHHAGRPIGAGFRAALSGQEQAPEVVQRGLHFAIVDEVDSVLLDEARTALILSSASGAPSPCPQVYQRADEVAGALSAQRDYTLDAARQIIGLTAAGRDRVFRIPGGHPASGLRRPWTSYIDQALRARHMLRRDVDYLVVDDKVQIIDPFTGRRYQDRSWSDGLHQAVEAAENLPVTEESQMVLRISRHRYLGFYERLSGMTGTARGSEAEFREFYHLPVVRVPLRRASRQRVEAARFFTNDEVKWRAIVDEIRHVHRYGRPVLVATHSVRDSERLSEILQAAHLDHRLLTAKQDTEEAEVVAAAGARGAITVATAMAGRGTDIPLQAGVAERGGLHVIITEAHESARVDRQIMGRSARQGQPGSARLFVAATDHLIAGQAPELGRKIAAGNEGESNDTHLRALARLQARIERQRHAERREIYRHDSWTEGTLQRA